MSLKYAMDAFAFKPHEYRIDQEDIFLVYTALQRSIHHFNVLQDNPKYKEDRIYSDYKEIFRYVKKICRKKQISINNQETPNANHSSVFEEHFKRVKNLFIKKHPFKDITDSWERDYNEHVVNFPTLTNVSIAHVHALIKHYVTDAVSDISKHLKSFKDKVFYSHDYYGFLCPSPMKETLLNIHPKKRLKWCVRLLVAYHYEDECSMFMASAFKLCVNAISLSPILKCKSADDLCGTMMWYFEFLRNYLAGAFPYRAKFIDYCTDYLFFMSSKNFHILLECGAAYGYSEERFLALELWLMEGVDSFPIPEIVWEREMEVETSANQFHGSEKEGVENDTLCPQLHNESTSQQREYYCFQVLYLFTVGHKRCRDEDLKAIWASISEPFLTRDELYTCFSQLGKKGLKWLPLPIFDLAAEIYAWYSDIVGAEENEMSPRSLVHLSKCAIRNHLGFPMLKHLLRLRNTL